MRNDSKTASKRPSHPLTAVLAALLAAWLLPALQIRAVDLDPRIPLSQYGMDVWDGSDGLPQIRIRAIVQTRDGYLWLGTANGLVRFDGVSFTTFGIHTGSLKDDEVSGLMEDREGALWIGTFGGGLTRMKDGRFKTFTTADGLPDDSIRKLDMDREGNIWVATARGVGRYAKGVITAFTTKDGLTGNFVSAICADAREGVFAAAGGRLSRFADGKFVAEPGVVEEGDGRLDSLESGVDGALWMTFENSSVKCWDGRKLMTYTRAEHKGNRPGAIYEDGEGTIWMGARDGLLRCRDGKFDLLSTPEAQAKLGLVMSMCADREGNLWLGTEANGLVRLRSVLVRMLTAEDGLPDGSTRCVYRDRRGDIWIGAYLGFARLSGGKVTAFTQIDGGQIPTVTSMGEDATGRLWVAAGGRLYTMEDESLTPVEGWRRVFDIKVIERDRQGQMWVGTDGDGLFRYADGAFTAFRTKDGLGGNQIRAIYSDREGALWVGTTAGLTRYRDGKFTNLTTRDGLANDRVMAVTEDADGVLWIATRNGLSRYEQGRFFNIYEKDGLPDSYIYNIVDDGRGAFWLSGGKGICRVSQRELNDFARGKVERIAAISLGYRDGLRTASLVAGTQPNACQGDGGQLLFCSLKGLAIVSPGGQLTNRLAPPVWIERVTINKQEEPLDRPPAIAAGPCELEIQYTALSFVAPEKVQFKYRLEGIDSGWVDAGRRRFAHYANLPPRAYRFQVIACNNDGVWNDSGATYAFRVPPRFYETAWFPVAVLVMVAGLAGGGYGLRIHRLRAHERELQRRVDEAVAEVNILSGLLPICGGCKKIRDDKGYWNQIESYITKHSDIQFSHGLCPDCLKRLYPDCADEVLNEMKALEEKANGPKGRE